MPLVLLLLLASQQMFVSAYPYLWATDTLPIDILKGAALTPANCISHPKTKEGGHGAPTVDRSISITTADATGKAVTQLCPGGVYTVTVKYAQPRRTLLTSTVGAWKNGNATCPGLLYTTKEEKASDKFTATLAMPCNTTAASTLLQVTSAAGPSAAFAQASLQVNILTLAKCPTSTCATTQPVRPVAQAALAPVAAPTNKTVAAVAMPVNKTMDANMTAAGNATSAVEGLAPAANATRALVSNITAVDAVNATAAAARAALNGTTALDALNGTTALDALNGTTALDALNGTTALDALNGTARAALDMLNATATAALDALNRTGVAAGVQPAEASKPKSSAVGSSPMGLLAAACAMAVVGVLAL